MEKLPPKQKLPRGVSREDLLKLSKEELVDRLIQLEAHNAQLKNIISKKLSDEAAVENQSNKNQKKFDFSKHPTRHVLLHILYFGWDYHGYVVQEDTVKTIEHHIFSALTRACLIESREKADYHRCGRTDKGVSAFGQVVSLQIRSRHAPEVQNTPEATSSELSYCRILNRLLPRDIRAVGWMPAPDGFSARFDCKKRQYKYYFPRSSLDIPAMRRACAALLGTHDFRNLCKMDVGNGVTQFTRHIITADVVSVDGDDDDNAAPTSMYYLLIEGNAFLWHQIRCIQAILLLVGSGQESPDVIAKLIDHLTYERKPQYNLAIDVPLNLFQCTYELDAPWLHDADELERTIRHYQAEWTLYNIKATMLKDCLRALEDKYSKAKEQQCADGIHLENKIIAYHECLTEGVKPKNYKPLMKRVTCSSLEEKIEHYQKRRKQYKPDDSTTVDSDK